MRLLLIICYILISLCNADNEVMLEDVITLPIFEFSEIFGTAVQLADSSAMLISTNGGLIRQCSKISGEYSAVGCVESLDIRSRVLPTDFSFAQFGLLGLAVNEDDVDNKLYVGYTAPCNSSMVDCSYYRGMIRVSHFTRYNSTHFNPNSEFILFEQPTGANSSDRHIGGGLLVVKYKGETVVLFGVGDNSPSPRLHPEQVFDECKLPFQAHRGDNARYYALCGSCPNNCTHPSTDNYYGSVIALDSTCTTQRNCKTTFSKIILDNEEVSVSVAKGFRMPYSIERDKKTIIIANVGESTTESIYTIKIDDLMEGNGRTPLFAGWNIREGPFKYQYLLNTTAQNDRAPNPNSLLGSSTFVTYPYAYYNHTNQPDGLGNSIIGAFNHKGDNLWFQGIVAADYTPADQGGNSQKYYYIDDNETNPGERVKQFNVTNADDFANRFVVRVLGLGNKNHNKRDVYLLMIDAITFSTTLTKLTDA